MSQKGLLNNFENHHTNNIDFDNDELIIDNPTKRHHSHKNNITGRLIILLLNPISGSQEGKIILDIITNHCLHSDNNIKIIKFPLKNSTDDLIEHNEEIEDDQIEESKDLHYSTCFDHRECFTVAVFNILDKEDYENGIQYISSYQENSDGILNLQILIGGGDGTVLQVVEQLSEKGIDLTQCEFGHIPLGTGNDLSNAMGFGNYLELDLEIESLHRVLYTYAIATSCKIDIWKLSLAVNEENGLINSIKKDQEQSMYDESGLKFVRGLTKTFINYMSIGFDAKVGFNFEQRRSSNRCVNKCIYCWEATKRILCCKTNITLTDILESFQIYQSSANDNKEKETFPSEIATPKCETLANHLRLEEIISGQETNDMYHPFINQKEEKKPAMIFGKKPLQDDHQSTGSVILKGDPINLICQNINFYFGGTRNIWEKSGNQLGIKMVDGKEEDIKRYKQEVLENFETQRFDDKKIEFFTYSSGMSIALENVAPGQASKIYQGKGPVIITFKNAGNSDEFAALNKVYLNVDGEYYHLLQPKKIKVELNDSLCNGQITFLKNEKGFI